MARENVLKEVDGKNGKVYLPFQPHFFNQVHRVNVIQKHFDISYLTKDDIDVTNNKLAHSTKLHDNVLELSKSTKEEDRHMVTNKKEIIDYGINDLFTRDQYELLLQPLEADILDYRYIVLCRKDDIATYLYCLPKECPFIKSNMYSMVVQCSGSKPLTVLAKKHLYQLIMSTPNSFHGISIVADAPECNSPMLNVTRPAVLRQYYGMNIGEEQNNLIIRVAYRSHFTTSSEGSDPRRLIIKPFSEEIKVMSKYIHQFLMNNVDDFHLQTADLR